MDGVIIDSEPQHAKAAVRTFKELGADVDIEYCYSFIGSSTKKMAETAIKDFSLDISTDELLEKLNKTKKEMLYRCSRCHRAYQQALQRRHTTCNSYIIFT